MYGDIKIDSVPHLEHLKSTRQLLNTLVTSPNLRPMIHHLTIQDWQTIDLEPKNTAITSFSLAELAEIVQSVPALGEFPLDYQRKLGIDLLQSAPDAMLAVILNLLPGLETRNLDVNRPHRVTRGHKGIYTFTQLDFSQTMAMRLIELGTMQPPSNVSLFTRLSHVTIRDLRIKGKGVTESSGWDTNLISFFLRLAVLKVFYGSGFRDMNNPSAWICDEGASSVTKITLYDCMIGAESMRRVLRSCHALEQFECIRLCEVCLDPEVEYDYSYANIHLDFHSHRESLHELFLDSKACWHSNTWQHEPIETLAGLTNLKTLRVDEDVLFGVHEEAMRSIGQFIPSNLQHLTIDGETHHYQNHLFREIWRFLISNKDPPFIELEGACIDDAEKMMKELPGIAIEEIERRDSDGFASFRMYKAEVEQSTRANGGEMEVGNMCVKDCQ